MLVERGILNEIFHWVPREEIVILTGPRQSGKTSLLRIIEKKLKDKGEQVAYFNLEDLELLGYLNQSPLNLLKLVHPKENQKFNVILDEIQYLQNPTNFLKHIYDDYREQIKLIVSGSSAFYIDRKFKDSLAGRKKIFYILPLDFADFLRFKGNEELLPFAGEMISLEIPGKPSLNPLQQRDAGRLLDEYMLYGGYPKIVLENDVSFKQELLQEILNSYIKKDAIEADVRFQEKFFALLRILASQTGSLVNAHELANTIGVSGSAIDNYLYVMRKSFHIRLVEPFYNNARKEITKMPKVYFFDAGLRNKIVNNFEPIDLRTDKGAIFENMVFKLLVDRFGWDTLKFWRTQNKNEVDFILANEKKAVEVKYNFSLFKPGKYSSFLSDYPEFSFHLIFHAGNALPLSGRMYSHQV